MESCRNENEKTMIKNWFRKKIMNPLVLLLQQGVTVEKLSWSLAAGLVLGCIPILGVTSALCFVVAVVFRLNHIAIQIANYIAYPIQFALLIPFLHLGNRIFGYGSMDFNISEMLVEFQIDPYIFFEKYVGVALRATGAWAIIGLVSVVVLFFIFKPFVQMLLKLKKSI